MRKIRLNVKTKSKIYPIIIGKNIITQIPNILKSNNINFEKSLIVNVDKFIIHSEFINNIQMLYPKQK